MDFSLTQREGFLRARFSSSGLDKAHAIPFLKGCYMHWIQSVQRIVSNYAVVPHNKSDLFRFLTYKMQKTTVDAVFVESNRRIITEFPCARRWIKWWLQPSITSTIFNCRTLMKDDFRKHDSRTSNAIESYHSVLYDLIPTKKELSTSLCLILKVSEKDGRIFDNYYQLGISSSYGGKKRKRQEENDGRAPDNNKTLFGKKKKKVSKEKKVDNTIEKNGNISSLENDINVYFEIEEGLFNLNTQYVNDEVHSPEKFELFEEHDAEMIDLLRGRYYIYISIIFGTKVFNIIL